MAEVQNKKKSSSKGKNKKGSPQRRSFFFKPATLILTLLTALLLILGILYLARVQHWFTSSRLTSVDKDAVGKRPPVVAKDQLAVTKTIVPREEYHNISPPKKSHQPRLQDDNAPQVAIIVDDLGADLGLMHDFLNVKLNLTAAILPNVPHARESADLAHASGHEVLLHLPMEPRDYPANNPGENALLLNLTDEELLQRLRDYKETVPWATGANNHMGSRFTEKSEGMKTVLQFLKEQEMFFLDSVTTADSMAIAEAEKLQVDNAERDLFLDNVQSEEAIRQQIRKLIKLAKEHGSAIGICHPHRETYAALRKERTTFALSGVNLVTVASLVHRP